MIGIFVAMVLFIAFEGYEIISLGGEEVKNPENDMSGAFSRINEKRRMPHYTILFSYSFHSG